MNSILTSVFLLSRWERAVWSAIEIASSVGLLGRYANWSGIDVTRGTLLQSESKQTAETLPKFTYLRLVVGHGKGWCVCGSVTK